MNNPALDDAPGEASLDAARLNLYAQAQGLQDFVTQLFSAAGAGLTAQAKALEKVTRPILVKLGRAVGSQQSLLDQVVAPILTGASSAIAEQGIQLAAAVADAVVPNQPRAPENLSVRPLPVPPRIIVPPAPASLTRAQGAAPTPAGLSDQLLDTTTNPVDYAPESPSSGVSESPGAAGDTNPDGVTNVVALRPCDLKAIVDALSRPSYNPYIDAARGLLTSEESKIVGFFGDAISEEFDEDPSGAVSQLLMQTIIANP